MANNTYTPFLRDKLFLSIYKSCKHRPEAIQEATHLTATVICKLLPSIKEGCIEIGEIAKVTASTLKLFDYTAFVQYQAFHPILTN